MHSSLDEHLYEINYTSFYPWLRPQMSNSKKQFFLLNRVDNGTA
jgi:hypothetical protein